MVRPARRGGTVAFAGLVLGMLVAGPAHAVTLDEAWEAAEQSNLDLALARQRTRQVATLRWQVASAYLPKVDVTVDQVWNQDELVLTVPNDFLDPGADPSLTTDIPIQARSLLQGNLTAIQPLVLPPAIPGLQAAARAYRAAQADEARAVQLVRAGAAEVFFGLGAAREAEVVAGQAVALAERQRDLAARQVAAGLVDRRASLQAELALAKARRDALAAREQVVTAEQAWTRVTGLPTDSVPELPPPVEVPPTLDAALARLDERPDVTAARLRWQASRAERTAKDLEWAPSLGFAFQELLTTAPGLVPAPFQWRALLRVQWNLFDGGLRLARSRELASRSASAEILVRQAEDTVQQDVVLAWERLERARAALASTEAEVALATENVDLAEKAFGAGAATFLEVEAARLALDAARLGLAAGRAEREVAAIRLRLALGTL